MLQFAKIAVHIAAVFFAFLLAYELRRGLPLEWWTTHPDAARVLGWAFAYAGLAGAVEILFRTERTSWRFTSARDAIALFRSTAITAALFLGLIFFTERAIDLPRSTLPITWLLSFLFLLGMRGARRVLHDPSLAFGLISSAARRQSGLEPLLVVGGVDHAERYLRGLLADAHSTYYPRAVVSTRREDVGLFIQGVPVHMTISELVERAEQERTRARPASAVLFLQEPVSELGLSAEAIGALKTRGHVLLRQPSVVELGREPQGALREIALEEFLPRAPVTLDGSRVREVLTGKRVLVTGAGGSIGSEIARQLAAFGCGHVTLLDHSEFALFEISREFARLDGGVSFASRLCNIRDAKRLKAVFLEDQPDVVFHAAALKHVTLVEQNPAEGFLTNVMGTANVIAAARGARVGQVVLISTDKAVAPTTVMGATKRLAEALVAVQPSGADVRYSMVRFGNVLGSAGSVVPIFREQIERGGPVTVTDPLVERYFMTIPEAVQLVLQATALSWQGSSGRSRQFVLEMGGPVRIVDLAKQMIALAGRTGEDEIKIEFTGLAPGEKLTEALVDKSETAEPCTPEIMEITSSTPPPADLEQQIADLARLVVDAPAAVTRERILALTSDVRSPRRIETPRHIAARENVPEQFPIA